ncbi:hypothetical protein D6745_04130 [Candidatus Woesearchaeota archaeon]|nr:MAG: hypothetical protein D6745_04130 [Candidatus Woesearchaeota archaeon]
MGRESCVKRLKEITGHNAVKLTPSGDHAVFLAFLSAKQLGKKRILIPDQGGWLTYKEYPRLLDLEIIEVKTDYGIINLEDLKNKAGKDSALICAQPAGYFAEQPIKKISSICTEKNCLLITDISGSIGDKSLIDKNADFMVCSFGRWKPVSLCFGGSISAKKGFPKEISSLTGFPDELCEKLEAELSKAEEKTREWYELSKKIKEDLKSFKIIHPEKKGINVVVEFCSEQEKKEILKYCERMHYEYTLCPRYIRVLEKAVSIEVKRL